MELYGKALEVAPWWPEGHFNRALILGETKKYWDAMREMKRYLLLVPDAFNARAAQDKIYQWEGIAGTEPENDNATHQMPVHRVTVAKPFALGKTEVTQGQWRAIMGNNPSHFKNCGDICPVERVSWIDAQEFIQKLNAKSGKQYRLPSEAEWEYACRAGGQHEFCDSDYVDMVAWYTSNSGGTTHPVAQKQANAFGLYDMSGNVWEWVEDCYDGDCATRVLRGGSWYSEPQYIRAANRYRDEPAYRLNTLGFRLVRMLP